MLVPEHCPPHIAAWAELLRATLFCIPWVDYVQVGRVKKEIGKSAYGMLCVCKRPKLVATITIADWMFELEIYPKDYSVPFAEHLRNLQESKEVQAFEDMLREQRLQNGGRSDMKHQRGGAPRSAGKAAIAVPVKVPTHLEMESEAMALVKHIGGVDGVESVTLLRPIRQRTPSTEPVRDQFRETKNGVLVTRSKPSFLLEVQVKARKPLRPRDLLQRLKERLKGYSFDSDTKQETGRDDPVNGRGQELQPNTAQLRAALERSITVRSVNMRPVQFGDDFAAMQLSELRHRSNGTWSLTVHLDGASRVIELVTETDDEARFRLDVQNALRESGFAALLDRKHSASDTVQRNPNQDSINFIGEVTAHHGLKNLRLKALVALDNIPIADQYGALPVCQQVSGQGIAVYQWLQSNGYVTVDINDLRGRARRYHLTAKAYEALNQLKHGPTTEKGEELDETPELNGEATDTEVTGDYRECLELLQEKEDAERFGPEEVLNEYLGVPAGAEVLAQLIAHGWILLNDYQKDKAGRPAYSLTEKAERLLHRGTVIKRHEARQTGGCAAKDPVGDDVVLDAVNEDGVGGSDGDPVDEVSSGSGDGTNGDTDPRDAPDVLSQAGEEVDSDNDSSGCADGDVSTDTLPSHAFRTPSARTTSSRHVEAALATLLENAGMLSNGAEPDRIRKLLALMKTASELGCEVKLPEGLSIDQLRSVDAAIEALKRSGAQVSFRQNEITVTIRTGA